MFDIIVREYRRPNAYNIVMKKFEMVCRYGLCLPPENAFHHKRYLETKSQQFDKQAVGMPLRADTQPSLCQWITAPDIISQILTDM